MVFNHFCSNLIIKRSTLLQVRFCCSSSLVFYKNTYVLFTSKCFIRLAPACNFLTEKVASLQNFGPKIFDFENLRKFLRDWGAWHFLFEVGNGVMRGFLKVEKVTWFSSGLVVAPRYDLERLQPKQQTVLPSGRLI